MKGLASDVLGQVEASAEEMGTGLLNGAMSLLHSSGSADQEASGEAKAAAPTASSGTSVAVSRDDKHLYTANSSGEVRIYSRDGETGMLELLKTVGPKPMPKGGLDAEEEARKVLQVLEQEYGSRKHTRDFFVKQAAYGGETKAGIELNTYPLQLLGPWILTLVPFMFLFFVEWVNTKGDTVWRRRPWLGFWAFLSPCIWNMLVLRKCLSAVAVSAVLASSSPEVGESLYAPLLMAGESDGDGILDDDRAAEQREGVAVLSEDKKGRAVAAQTAAASAVCMYPLSLVSTSAAVPFETLFAGDLVHAIGHRTFLFFICCGVFVDLAMASAALYEGAHVSQNDWIFKSMRDFGFVAYHFAVLAFSLGGFWCPNAKMLEEKQRARASLLARHPRLQANGTLRTMSALVKILDERTKASKFLHALRLFAAAVSFCLPVVVVFTPSPDGDDFGDDGGKLRGEPQVLLAWVMVVVCGCAVGAYTMYIGTGWLILSTRSHYNQNLLWVELLAKIADPETASQVAALDPRNSSSGGGEGRGFDDDDENANFARDLRASSLTALVSPSLTTPEARQSTERLRSAPVATPSLWAVLVDALGHGFCSSSKPAQGGDIQADMSWVGVSETGHHPQEERAEARALSLFDVCINTQKLSQIVEYLDLREYILSHEMIWHYKVASGTLAAFTGCCLLIATYLTVICLVQSPRYILTPGGATTFLYATVITIGVISTLSVVAQIYGAQSTHLPYLQRLQIGVTAPASTSTTLAARTKVVVKLQAHVDRDEDYTPEVLGIRVRPTFVNVVYTYLGTAVAAVVGKVIIEPYFD
jgi:hypothetical protein